jgi:hypothetical protein
VRPDKFSNSIKLANGVSARLMALIPNQFAQMPISHLQQAICMFKVMVVMADGKHGFSHFAQLRQ